MAHGDKFEICRKFAEAIQLEGCARKGMTILYIWDGLQHVLKVLYGSITWEGFFTSELEAYFVFSILLALNAIV